MSSIRMRTFFSEQKTEEISQFNILECDLIDSNQNQYKEVWNKMTYQSKEKSTKKILQI